MDGHAVHCRVEGLRSNQHGAKSMSRIQDLSSRGPMNHLADGHLTKRHLSFHQDVMFWE